MGKFTEYEIRVDYEKETVGEAVSEVANNFEEQVRKYVVKDGSRFDVNIRNVEDHGNQVLIELSGDNPSNAQWQVMAFIKILQEEKIYPQNICADKVMTITEVDLLIEDLMDFDTSPYIGK